MTSSHKENLFASRLLDNLAEASLALARVRDVGTFYKTVLETFCSLFQARAGILYALNGTHDSLVPVCSAPIREKSGPVFLLERGQSELPLIDILYLDVVFETGTSSDKAGFVRLCDILFGKSGTLVAVPGFQKNAQMARFIAFLHLDSTRSSSRVKQVALQFAHVGAEFFDLIVQYSFFKQDAQHLTQSIGKLKQDCKRIKRSVPDVIGTRLVGKSEAMVRAREQIARYANSALSTLILGETGTGKELAAESLHQMSARCDKPFIVENVAALPEQLVESELFGHVKGAFTGATRDKVGLLAQANGGTLFLDEIGDMPAAIQPKLLRSLQEKAVRPVGSEQKHAVDFRLITATHHDMPALVRSGAFRQDLFYRIAQLVLRLPSLHSRPGDIKVLAQHFLKDIATRENTTIKQLEESALEVLMDHSFPGNVRELRTLVERVALITGSCRIIRKKDVVLARQQDGHCAIHAPTFTNKSAFLPESGTSLQSAISSYERVLLEEAYTRFEGNRTRIAESFEIPKSTLATKLKRFGII